MFQQDVVLQLYQVLRPKERIRGSIIGAPTVCTDAVQYSSHVHITYYSNTVQLTCTKRWVQHSMLLLAGQPGLPARTSENNILPLAIHCRLICALSVHFRSQGYSAHVRIASQDRVMLAEDTDEVLSFGTYSSAGAAAFEPHASLNAQANGSLAVRAGGLNLLPGGGDTVIGSGKFESVTPMHSDFSRACLECEVKRV